MGRIGLSVTNKEYENMKVLKAKKLNPVGATATFTVDFDELFAINQAMKKRADEMEANPFYDSASSRIAHKETTRRLADQIYSTHEKLCR